MAKYIPVQFYQTGAQARISRLQCDFAICIRSFSSRLDPLPL